MVCLVATTTAARAQTRPGKPGPLPVAATVIDEGCDFDLDGRSLVWSDPLLGGEPETIEFGDGDLGEGERRCPGNPPKLVDMKVRVHYPGNARRVAEGGPFPLVVVLHGQQPFDIPGYEGFDDLGRLLASHGYVVASIDGRSLLDSTIKSRGEHVREHLRRFAKRNARGSGSLFEGELDLSRVALIGHSRGGEAVVAAWEWQRVAPDPGYAIAAIVALAPVQMFARGFHQEPSFVEHLRDVGFQLVVGLQDCDVDDFQGLRLYDRAADHRAPGQTLKSLVYVERANHNFHNAVWEQDMGSDCAPETPVLPGVKTRAVDGAYIQAFLDTVVRGGTRWRPYLTGERGSPVPGTKTAVDFQAPASDFVAVDDFEDEPHGYVAFGTNSLGGTSTTTGLEGTEVKLSGESGFGVGVGRDGPFSFYRGESYFGHLAWARDARDAVWESEIPADVAARLGALDHVSFRVGQFVVPYDEQPRLDLWVELVDESGAVSSPVSLRRYAAIRRPSVGPSGKFDLLATGVRIPLRAFRKVNARLPRAVRIRPRMLSGARDRATTAAAEQRDLGHVAIDDLRFTR